MHFWSSTREFSLLLSLPQFLPSLLLTFGHLFVFYKMVVSLLPQLLKKLCEMGKGQSPQPSTTGLPDRAKRKPSTAAPSAGDDHMGSDSDNEEEDEEEEEEEDGGCTSEKEGRQQDQQAGGTGETQRLVGSI